MNKIILFIQGEKRSCITKINNWIWQVVGGINTASLQHLKGGKLLHGIFQFLLPAKMDKSSTLEYINQMFPTEASLSGVEPLMQKIKSEINHVDSGILAAVRQQSNSGTKAKEDLAAATRAVEELMYKI
ncbi:hypothetical protein CMV_027209 [Castanea mollissima]|uniref:Vps53 N-terminal domain-containing protein n=1 Tax=Castanea mollissima TaxID=60419 RepID=A0A8J4QA05_9ROSI|nr:hypothetical protein CMV_027209 [Castanea mollissima]